MDGSVIVAAGAAVATVIAGWQARGAKKAGESNGVKLDNGIKESLARIEGKVDRQAVRLEDHIQAHEWRRYQ